MASTATTLPTPAHSINGTTASDHHDGVMVDDFTLKRKRTDHDFGLTEKKAYLEDPRKLGIEDLHLDVGEKYLLCRTRKAPFCHFFASAARYLELSHREAGLLEAQPLIAQGSVSW